MPNTIRRSDGVLVYKVPWLLGSLSLVFASLSQNAQFSKHQTNSILIVCLQHIKFFKMALADAEVQKQVCFIGFSRALISTFVFFPDQAYGCFHRTRG